eukprot:TRINITY_DN59335_c0_g1_i1.p1 TRINITY_DN59335_c0_g1~~TRINITY_DN59335_c0_g1_i1.p1  ORF type:complete len:519 (-),score=98.41 TRINITY_DN59335_c0_g1_i1:17-1519(-)
MPEKSAPKVLVVGSLNVDLYKKIEDSSIELSGKAIDVTPIKGSTLPAKSFVENKDMAKQLEAANLKCVAGEEESLLLKLGGPFEQKTGGKGANAAAAAGQTCSCALICNFGKQSEDENKMLLADLKKFGKVNTKRSGLIDGPTGTAYILSFADGDNAILLLGGANQNWPDAPLAEEGSQLYEAVSSSVAVMLQREVPEYVNVEVARCARKLNKPVFMDVGGTDAPLDEKLMPFISEIAPNESEIRFISGVETMRDGKLEKGLLREAVAALKAKFAAAGNSTVEVLVTLGSQGSMHFGSQWANSGSEDLMGLLPHETQMGVFRLETSDGRPKDTTGAGDCFRGSYVAARYGEGESLQQAMKWATAASSLSVEVHGAMPSMPDRKKIQARVAKDISSGLCETSAVEMKVTLKKPTKFYIQAARSFLKGIEARPADGDRKAVEAKPPVPGLRISGLGQACGVALATASQIVGEKLGRIQSIKTAYPNLSGKSCPQVIIDIVQA